jgi:hypothetical protein
LWQQFQHGNASVHKWFVEIGVEELDWPAQSPDFNPIEHLCDELECRLRAMPKSPNIIAQPH